MREERGMMIFERANLARYRVLKGQWYRLAVDIFTDYSDVNTLIVCEYAPRTQGYKWAEPYKVTELVQGKGLVEVSKYPGDIYYYKKYRRASNVKHGRVVEK